jgi:glycerol-3-phosphate dehydrogenase (NAD(P)+)
VVVTTKGIEEVSLDLPLDVAGQELGGAGRLAVLSGPSFAREVALGRPTALVVAAKEPALAARLQRSVSSRELRVYTNQDPLGVQVAGALKNVMAIAVGIADSLGLGANARAALITRGLAEMSRLVLALGGAPNTTAGLAGLGDLVLTCTGELSRNRRVGQRLGLGERLQDILDSSRSVAEGVRTTVAVRALAGQSGVEMPIVHEVHRILHEDGRPHEGLERLLSRPLRSEEGPPRTGRE